MSSQDLPQSHAELIARCGIAALARALHLSQRTVGAWKIRNSIPGRYFLAVVDAAQALGVSSVTVDLLARLAAAADKASPARDRADCPSGAAAPDGDFSEQGCSHG